jgi:hypothetical protein
MRRRRLLPDDSWTCTAYWYAFHGGMWTGDWPSDLEFLRELGYRAAARAHWHGVPERRVPEGPHWVHQWPEWIFAQTADAMASHAAEHGDYGPPYPPLA